MTEHEECPICRRPGSIEPPEQDTIQLLIKLPLKCQNFELGCTEKIRMQQWIEHNIICEYRLTPCPRNCGTMIPAIAMPRHTYVCTLGCDPILQSLLCFVCKGKYQAGIIPTHCDYADFAKELWDNGNTMYWRSSAQTLI